MANIFRNNYTAKKVAREVSILRQLAKMKTRYVSKLLDVIIPYQFKETKLSEKSHSGEELVENLKNRKNRLGPQKKVISA